MTAPEWKQHPFQRSVWTLDLGPLRLSACETGWWCAGHMKKQPVLSIEGAKVKALFWARGESARITAALDAIDQAGR